MAKNRKHRSRMAPILWATALFYAPFAQALGLGPLAVTSNLGQPLRAEIPLLSLHRGERHSVHVALASSADFTAAGLRKSRALRAIHCRIQRVGSGYEILLRSRQPINEPFLHFLLHVRWSGGSLMHMYTALLNPTSGITLVQQGRSMPQARPIVSEAAAPTPMRLPRSRSRHPATTVIRPGETLWAVAARTAPHAGTMPQALEAFLRTNPAAFFHKNVNDLRAGSVLRIPTTQEIRALSAHHATVWLASQDQAWQRYKNRLAQNPATAVGASAGVAGTLTRARLLPAARRPLRIEAARLTTATGAGGGGRASGSASFERRVQRLKKELQKTRRLMTLEDQELALLERQAAARAAHAPAAAAGTIAKTVPTAVKHVVAPAAHVMHDAATVKPHPTQPVRRVAPVRPLPPLAPAPSFLSTLLTSERTPILGALLVIVLGGGLLAIRRRRQSMAEFEESILSGGGLSSEGQMPDTAGLPKTPDVSFLSEFSQGNAGGALHTDEVDPLAEADVYLAYGRDEQAEEILREAAAKEPARLELKLKLLEIYLQRRDKKTFEIVAEEIYAASEGRGPAWQKVEELGRKLDPANPLFKGNVRNPQVGAGPVAGDDEPASGAGISDRIDFAAVARELAEVSAPRAASTGLEDEEGSLDWSLNDDVLTPEPSPNEPIIGDRKGSGSGLKDNGSLDFSLDLGRPSELAEDPGQRLPDASSAEDAQAESVDFHWDHSLEPAAKLNGEAAEGGADEFAIRFDEDDTHDLAAGDLDLRTAANSRQATDSLFGGDISFEPVRGEAEEGDLVLEADTPDGHAVDTKLDLARVYIDMGDKDGAHGILEEVRAEGNPAQRALAEQLMGAIA